MARKRNGGDTVSTVTILGLIGIGGMLLYQALKKGSGAGSFNDAVFTPPYGNSAVWGGYAPAPYSGTPLLSPTLDPFTFGLDYQIADLVSKPIQDAVATWQARQAS